MYIKFWGVRGSIPVPGKDTIKYGGNTTCIEIRTNDGNLLIIDAGTGIRLLGLELMKGEFGQGTGTAHILFTHSHWDHIQGFPFFLPAYVGAKNPDGSRIPEKSNQLHLYGASDVDGQLETTLRGQMEYFYFPVDLNYLNAQIHFHPITNNEINIGNTKILVRKLIHPNGVLGYRIVDGNSVVTIATDCEHPQDGSVDSNLLELSKNADILIYDAQYTPEEYNPAQFGINLPSKMGWGHSTYFEGIKVAKAANVKRLILTHHDPQHTDKIIDEIQKKANEILPGTIAAFEGLVLHI